MVMETRPTLAVQATRVLSSTWPLLTPNPALMLLPGREEAKQGGGYIPAPTSHPGPRNGRHPQEVTRAVTLIKLPPSNHRSHPQATRSRGHGQNQCHPPPPLPRPQHLFFCSQMHVLASEDPFWGAKAPQTLRAQRNAKQPVGWRAGQPDSSLIQVILDKSRDLSDPTPHV